jgi:hypothetical protein
MKVSSQAMAKFDRRVTVHEVENRVHVAEQTTIRCIRYLYATHTDLLTDTMKIMLVSLALIYLHVSFTAKYLTIWTPIASRSRLLLRLN